MSRGVDEVRSRVLRCGRGSFTGLRGVDEVRSRV